MAVKAPAEQNGSAEDGVFEIGSQLLQEIVQVLVNLPYGTPTGVSGHCTGDLVNILRVLEPIAEADLESAREEIKRLGEDSAPPLAGVSDTEPARRTQAASD